jgi:hypothetical protein
MATTHRHSSWKKIGCAPPKQAGHIPHFGELIVLSFLGFRADHHRFLCPLLRVRNTPVDYGQRNPHQPPRDAI